MAKLKINERQYNAIINSGAESRLNNITDILVDKPIQDKVVVEEGFKEFILGAALVLSQAMGGKVLAQTGHNKAVADKAVESKEIMAQLKATLEDENKTKELADSFKELGLKNPDTLLANNAEKVIDAFNKISQDNNLKYRLDTKAVTNLKALGGLLKKGYALKDKETSVDSVPSSEIHVPVTVNDTISVDFGSDNFFVTGGYELSPAGIDSIKTAIDEVKKQGGTIISVNVESSTDAERIKKFTSEYDPTGNIKLAELRSKSVTDLVSSLTDSARITHREIPNNGSDVVSTKEFSLAAHDKEAIASLREQTSKFRYVKLTIVATFEAKDTAQTTPPADLIKHYRFELVKVIMSNGKTKHIKTNVSFKHKKFKCKKKSIGGRIVDACETFSR